ncbi:MAG: DUF1015 family protein [Thermodesulfobacteriota bacterium]|nr:DUF1015 family protein [Thermodesulfobacteriota bacterium]
MAAIIPFRAVRPQKRYVKKVASCPYDILTSDEARKTARKNKKSFLHVIKSEIDLPEDINAYDDIVYETSRKNLFNFLKEGTMFQEGKECFYIYQQKMGNHVQNGIVACIDTSDYIAGYIKRHELTRTDKEADRTKHIDVLNAQTGPVFLTHRAVDAVDRIVGRIVEEKPEYNFIADDGIAHTVWKVDDDTIISDLQGTFLKRGSLYIADGHHRAASAVSVARMRRRENPNHNGNEEYNRMMAVIFPDNQLKIMDYNRLVRDLNGMTEEEFLKGISENFVVSPGYKKKAPEKIHEFGMYLDKKWYRLCAKEGSYDEGDVVGALDVSILQDNVLTPILGIGDVRTDERIAFVGGILGMKKLEEMVDSGEFTVAFSLYPTTMDQLMIVSNAGKIMPPKSTWFEPKLRSGLFVHLLD